MKSTKSIYNHLVNLGIDIRDLMEDCDERMILIEDNAAEHDRDMTDKEQERYDRLDSMRDSLEEALDSLDEAIENIQEAMEG